MPRRLAHRLLIAALAALVAASAGAQAPQPGFRRPPPGAYEDCRGKAPGDRVRHRTPRGFEDSTCLRTPDGFVAVPDSHLGRRQEPPPRAYDDCRGKAPGDPVLHQTPQGLEEAICEASPQGLVARPNRLAAPPRTEPIPAPTETARAQAEPPRVTLLPVAPTTAQVVDIAGSVSAAGRITAVMVDGGEIPVAPDGGFSVRRGVPLGDSEINVVAIDEWGRRGEARLTVTRAAAANTEVFAPLKPALARGKPRPDSLALIIGIERYKSAPAAEFAENDARAFYDYAVNALGVPAARVKLLTGANAQKVDVEAALLTWLKPLIVRESTEVFVFFSGHGLASDDGRDLYLLPQDGNRAVLERSALRRKEMIEMILAASPRSATLFLDTCYSGGTRGADSLIASARPVLLVAKDESLPERVTILAASANDQLSSSLVPAKHGLFSYFLMKGLEGEAAGPDRAITAAGLTAYLAARIPTEAAKLGRTQVPQLLGDGDRVISAR